MSPEPPVTSLDVGLYVHFPYCERKCPYCDFNVYAIPHDDTAYANAVLAEIAGRAPAFRPPHAGLRSVYFGGGTPSEWHPSEVARIIADVRERVGVDERAEITVETNPGTVAEARLEAFGAAGVNRFSIGAQSFDDTELAALGRTHDKDSIARTVRAARATGARISLDLIYGLPGQSWSDVRRSISAAIDLGPDHVSAYTLTVEPRTPLGRSAALGRFVPMDDDATANLIEAVEAELGRAGFSRYEVSSFAREGFEAVHNSIYWAGGPYLGVGAGAHSYLPAPRLAYAHRRENVRAPSRYLETAGAGTFVPEIEERLSRRDALGERLFVAFRTKWGIEIDALASEAGLVGDLGRALEPTFDPLVREGLIEKRGRRLCPTERGFLFNDRIASAMLHGARGLPPEWDA